MKTFVAVALGVLALAGCGPRDESEATAQALEEAMPDAGQRSDAAPQTVPRNPAKADQEKLYAPEAATFLTTFIYQSDLDSSAAPFTVEPLPAR
jgi:hypothetical protein